MMGEFLKGDQISSRSSRADGLCRVSRDANNSTVEIHHLKANPLLLARVPDSRSGTEEWEKKILSFSNHFGLFCGNKSSSDRKTQTSVHSYPVSRNDPRNSFTADKNYKFWCSARQKHSKVQSLQHQCVQNHLTPLKWSHIFCKDQTRFGSLTIRKEWAKRRRWVSVMILKSTARQRWIALDKSSAKKAYFCSFMAK